MTDPEQRKADLDRLRELAEGAKATLEDRAFQTSILSLRTSTVAEIIAEPANTLRQGELCSRLRCLDGLEGELKRLMNDYKMALQRKA
jgi:hypothetical protein